MELPSQLHVSLLAFLSRCYYIFWFMSSQHRQLVHNQVWTSCFLTVPLTVSEIYSLLFSSSAVLAESASEVNLFSYRDSFHE